MPEDILLQLLFGIATILGNGWLILDLFSRHSPDIRRHAISIILAGLLVTNITVQTAWIVTGNYMELEKFGTGVRGITLAIQDRDLIFFACLLTCSFLLVSCVIRRTLHLLRSMRARSNQRRNRVHHSQDVLLRNLPD